MSQTHIRADVTVLNDNLHIWLGHDGDAEGAAALSAARRDRAQQLWSKLFVGIEVGQKFAQSPTNRIVEENQAEWLPGVGEIPNYIHAIALPTVRRGLDRAASRAQKRAEILCSKPPSLRERAQAFARERGVVTTAELQAIGLHRCYLTPMCDEGLLVRVGHGRYRAGEGQADAA